MAEQSTAIIFERPNQAAIRTLGLRECAGEDVLVRIEMSAVSTGTERLLFEGRMPAFPGLAYPLVPGYEAIGHVLRAGPDSALAEGQRVFVPGSNGFEDARGLFGASASHVVVPESRLLPLPDHGGSEWALLALAATAHHALKRGPALPSLIVGHGALGRIAARLVLALGGPAPIVWETDDARRAGAQGYAVVDPAADQRAGHRVALDLSGDPAIIDALAPRMGKGGAIVLGGFYADAVRFAFPPAFMAELSMIVAAEWTPADLAAVRDLVAGGVLSLGDIITHEVDPREAGDAYRTAFSDPSCLKMTLNWKALS